MGGRHGRRTTSMTARHGVHTSQWWSFCLCPLRRRRYGCGAGWRLLAVVMGSAGDLLLVRGLTAFWGPWIWVQYMALARHGEVIAAGSLYRTVAAIGSGWALRRAFRDGYGLGENVSAACQADRV